ncbi:MAG: hypothetical protein BTN85_1324 [Candidatus Methanohalarchaeum thermophilum]|uniref:Uncharacterized protein n=1 Tax=Methanohalarchaeum thermophilum TaxID=1903181 RepID=A0A1Q6DWS9_METT1|nr:MAG: hypothetical protein BTN85_1324 [Candidatus Methanohalarchaeum thermophilum]
MDLTEKETFDEFFSLGEEEFRSKLKEYENKPIRGQDKKRSVTHLVNRSLNLKMAPKEMKHLSTIV